ncbi:RING-like domain-containing protein [Truncatella angustata]|uniref:Non-structural maintenance of chromosomes element 1 homolog n=1 Tax=Truncatella angustata TaxID=152316 RepID=A0A9P8UWU9_9PEZI|nr:RING-like domain-containing protein [Truncatella angustata]KAH6659640.1 RING-like domain-containing protein [Truncatella angustata]KAH8201263.1 hypothetical protein TruAng_004580 [Truncatella angustata]
MDGGIIPPDYDDSNRAFLQALMARGTITYREAKPILANILTAQHDADERVDPSELSQEVFAAYIAAAQEAVSHFDYEIRNTLHQVRKERVYAVVNTTSDAMTQLATLHTPDQIAFVKRVIDAMFENYNTRRMEVMSIDSMQANKFRHAPRQDADESVVVDGEEQAQATQGGVKSIKTSEVSAVLAALVEEGWFEKSRDGFYSLSPRALMELRTWLVDAYNDPDLGPDDWQRIKFCEACKEIVTVGQRCADRDCNVRIHDICEEAFWRTRRDKACPRCSTAWSGKHFVGLKAVTETEAYKRGNRRTGGRGSLMEEIIQDEDGEMDEEDE